MNNPIDPTNISLLSFMRLSREENLNSQTLDDLVSRLGTQALNELKVLSRVERARLGFDLRRFQQIASPESTSWLNEMLSSEETIEAEGSAEVKKKIDRELKAEFEAGLKKWLSTEESRYKHDAARKIHKVYESDETRLDLYDYALKTLPPEIGQLTNLQTLYLARNQLKEVPASRGQLTNLETLYFARNQLKEVPASVVQLTNLTILDLAGNQLKEVPATFGQLTNLVTLNLMNNQLKELTASFGQLTKLKELYLSYNQFEKVPASLGQLTNLKELFLESNQLKKLTASLGQLAKLEQLDLSNNQLKKLPASFGQLANLERLHLSNNQLKELTASVGQLTNLKNLYLTNNQFEKVPASLGQLTNLKSLFLDKNQLKSAPAFLGQVASLEILFLHNNQLKEVPASLGQLANLKGLYLSENQLEELPVTLGQLTNLTVLYLDYNRLKAVPALLGQVANLETLFLNNNRLKEVPASLGQLFSLEKLEIHDNPELSDLPLSLGSLPGITYLDTQGTLIPDAMREAILGSWYVARRRQSDKKLLQTLNLWKTKAGSETDFTFLTKIPILSAEKLGGPKEVARKEADDPLDELSLRVRMNDHLYDLTFDEISDLWKIKKETLSAKIQEGTYLEGGSFSSHQQAILYEWLVRLSRTGDYSHSQKALTQRVCQVLEALKEDPKFRERFFIIADANNERCGDRAAMSLNEIYTAYLLTNLPEEASTQDKLKLLVGLAKTYTLRKTLAQMMANHSGLDESVEIFLAKETTLKERLSLVTAVETMIFERIGQREWIDDETLVQAVNANYFDQLFDFEQFKELMQEDPNYKSRENKQTDDFDKLMDTFEEQKEILSNQDSRLHGEKLVDEKTKTLKELAREWVERVLASQQEIR